MRKAFKASRLIGLLALALGLMAFSATAAQAETGAFWEIENSEGTFEKLGGSAGVQAEEDSAHSTLLTKVGTSTVEILCGPPSFINASLSGTGAKGKIHYQECTTKLNGTAASRCTPKSPGATTGLIETNALGGLLKLTAAKEDVLELFPETGTAFATLELGSLCAIGNRFDITGKVTLKDCEGHGLVNQVKHLFEEGPESALLFGGNAATIDGSAWGFLITPNAGREFSGHPV